MMSLEAPSTGGSAGLAEPPAAGGLKEPGADLKEPSTSPSSPAKALAEPATAPTALNEPPGAASSAAAPPTTATSGLQEPPSVSSSSAPAQAAERKSTPTGYWIFLGIVAAALAAFYAVMTFERFEIFKMLLTSFFPLLFLILAVLGSIVFGLATPTEAAAVGAFGGYFLAAVYSVIGKRKEGRARVFLIWGLLWAPLVASIVWFALHKSGTVATAVTPAFGLLAILGVAVWAMAAYKQAKLQNEVKESVFLSAKTSAMVCWLFVGSAIFSAAFALLGGQELVENWVLGMNLTKTEFLILSQAIIFVLGWPLEWTEIIVIFMPIFIPLLDNFGVDPLFFGLLVALNLQTAFLSPPVAMAAFYLKGVSPPGVTLNQIFAGMLPFMGIQVLAIVLLYNFPAIGMWLPQVLYK
jgi:TRAP-type mannitol/chloroaromatic compound transport system permease large subunit